jgi:hypothetical protein
MVDRTDPPYVTGRSAAFPRRCHVCAVPAVFPDGPEGAFVHPGLPGWFKAELTTAKILGVLALLIPSIPVKLKEFAYSGSASP